MHEKEQSLPKNYRIDKILWKLWYLMEKKALYGVAGKLKKQGFPGKTTKKNFGRFGNIFSMVPVSDIEMTRQNAKEYWKINTCRT